MNEEQKVVVPEAEVEGEEVPGKLPESVLNALGEFKKAYLESEPFEGGWLKRLYGIVMQSEMLAEMKLMEGRAAEKMKDGDPQEKFDGLLVGELDKMAGECREKALKERMEKEEQDRRNREQPTLVVPVPAGTMFSKRGKR